MKRACILSLITIGLTLTIGCDEDESPTSTTPPLQGTPFEIPAWDYATNHFFVDTTYMTVYEQYYQVEPSVLSPNLQVVEEEVWVQTNLHDPNHLANSRPGVAYINLNPHGQGYDSTLRSPAEVPGQIESGRFYKLNRSEYQMTADGYLGVVSLRLGVEDEMAIGIAYERADGAQFGEFSWDVNNSPSPIILKMVKPRNLFSNGSTYRVAWEQLLKNIYAIGPGVVRVRELGFTLNILFGPTPSGTTNQIQNQPLLRVLGLDRYSPNSLPTPDGLFDFRPGRTIDPAAGEIILPFLRPFDNGIREYFVSHSLPFDTSYITPGIYDTTKTSAQMSPHYFKMNGRVQSY